MPDWTKASDYAFTKALDSRGWAWEFMRRNPEYRADHASTAKAWRRLPRVGHLIKGPEVHDVDRHARQLAAKWGMKGFLVDPATDQAPRFLRRFPIQPNGDQIEAYYDPPEDGGPPVQKSRYATLTFDLQKPLASQLKDARAIMKKRQTELTVIKAPHKGKNLWLLYLRVLDANEAGAKTSEIIKRIAAYKNLANTAADKYMADDRVSDHRARALELRDNPLSLIR